MDCRTLMRRAAAHFAGRTAIVHGETRLSFAQAWTRGLRLANALLALGLRPGDRVGVLGDNNVEAADIFLGAAAANLVRVPL
ncbi:MAG: AMP-binding protein, partial [Burkholderiales bacterium]